MTSACSQRRSRLGLIGGFQSETLAIRLCCSVHRRIEAGDGIDLQERDLQCPGIEHVAPILNPGKITTRLALIG